MTVSFITIQAEDFGDFFKNVGKKGPNISKNVAKNTLKNPSRALDLITNNAAAAAGSNPKKFLSILPEVSNFYRTASGSYLGKFVWFMLYKCRKKTDRLCPSAPLEKKNIELEKRLEKK